MPTRVFIVIILHHRGTWIESRHAHGSLMHLFSDFHQRHTLHEVQNSRSRARTVEGRVLLISSKGRNVNGQTDAVMLRQCKCFPIFRKELRNITKLSPDWMANE